MAYKKSYRPKILPDPTSLDRVYDMLTYAALAILLIVPALYFNQLPEEIPTHFNGLGEADRYGSKMTIWIMPILGIFLFVILTLLLRIPHSYNFPVPLHEQNVEKQYSMALTVMRSIRFFTIALLMSITIKTILLAFGQSTFGIDVLFWICLLAVIFVPVYYYFQALKVN